jgi:hypothetical protein
MRLLLPLVLLALLALPPAAHAATVGLVRSCELHKGVEVCGQAISLSATPGEVNDVTADPAADGMIVLRDAGAALIAQAGCTQVDIAAVRCPSLAGTVLLADGTTAPRWPPAASSPSKGDPATTR